MRTRKAGCRVALVGLHAVDLFGTLPNALSLGYLKAYADDRLAGRADIKIFQFALENARAPASAMEEVLSYNPDIVGFSCQHWNILEVMRLTKEAKKTLGSIRVVLGGPEASGRGKALLEECDADAIVFGEGEATFLEMLLAFLDGAPWAGIDGTWVRQANAVAEGKPRGFIEALDSIPSAYLRGLCPIPKAGNVTAVLETSRGCPKSCAFCAWTYTGRKPRYFSMERVKSEIEWILKAAEEAEVGWLPVFVGDADMFLNHARALEIARFIRTVATPRVLWLFQTDLAHWSQELAEAVNHEKFFFMVGVESINERALRNANRSVRNLERLERNIEMVKMRAPKAKFILQLMIGLPGDTLESFRRSLDWGAQRGACDFFLTQVFPGTQFHAQAPRLRLKHGPAPQYFVESCPGFPKKDIQRAAWLAFHVCVLMGNPLIARSLRELAIQRCGGSVSRAFEKVFSRLSPAARQGLDEIWRKFAAGNCYAGLENRIDPGTRERIEREFAQQISSVLDEGARSG